MHAMSFSFSFLLTRSHSTLIAVTAFQLNPSTPPGEIIERQLAALKDGDFGTVYEFASPGNKEQTGNVANFAKMVRSGPYRYLVGHSRSDILLESKIAASCQFLVRVISTSTSTSSSLDLDLDEEGEDELLSSQDTRAEKVMEYWWSLSRCRSGEFTGSYMVDAVIPNRM